MCLRELMLVFLAACTSDAFDGELGVYGPGTAPDGGPYRPSAEAGADVDAPDVDASSDADADGAPIDAGTCVRDQSRDIECVGYDADGGSRYAIRCPADDAGNPTLPPPAIGCNYTGWADAGSLTMCCK